MGNPMLIANGRACVDDNADANDDVNVDIDTDVETGY